MEQQNYSNHRRYVPAFHFLTASLALVIFIYYTIRLVRTLIAGHRMFTHLLYYCIMPTLVGLTLLLLFWFCRQFAIKAQDRAIRAEESLRYFILTGKAIDPRITMGQIIALRFAPDDEFIGLAQQAIDKNMSRDEIKKSIKNWRADNYRA